eukprot:TRINITY_DN4659_c0_g1_i2.p1 TRINITY_DN4659_c0_g1~~TRINITY_DN4659_c0_g1_i2.p1  ORF type:complete len:500 (-),score=109.47 TRINITY_DN4659_c0_g1_i2:123-1622(-)
MLLGCNMDINSVDERINRLRPHFKFQYDDNDARTEFGSHINILANEIDILDLVREMNMLFKSLPVPLSRLDYSVDCLNQLSLKHNPSLAEEMEMEQPEEPIPLPVKENKVVSKRSLPSKNPISEDESDIDIGFPSSSSQLVPPSRDLKRKRESDANEEPPSQRLRIESDFDSGNKNSGDVDYNSSSNRSNQVSKSTSKSSSSTLSRKTDTNKLNSNNNNSKVNNNDIDNNDSIPPKTAKRIKSNTSSSAISSSSSATASNSNNPPWMDDYSSVMDRARKLKHLGESHRAKEDIPKYFDTYMSSILLFFRAVDLLNTKEKKSNTITMVNSIIGMSVAASGTCMKSISSSSDNDLIYRLRAALGYVCASISVARQIQISNISYEAHNQDLRRLLDAPSHPHNSQENTNYLQQITDVLTQISSGVKSVAKQVVSCTQHWNSAKSVYSELDIAYEKIHTMNTMQLIECVRKNLEMVGGNIDFDAGGDGTTPPKSHTSKKSDKN